MENVNLIMQNYLFVIILVLVVLLLVLFKMYSSHNADSDGSACCQSRTG